MGKPKYTAPVETVVREPPESHIAPSTPCVPKAYSFNGQSPRKYTKVKSPDATAYVSVLKVCSEAMLFLNEAGQCIFPNIRTVNNNVYMVAVAHPESYPSIDYQTDKGFDAMFRRKSTEDALAPRSWEDFLQSCHVRAVSTGTHAPYGLPSVSYTHLTLPTKRIV